MKVMGRWSVKTVDVRADGTGLSSRAGTALLALVADRVGLTGGLCDALAGTRERRSAHDPGRVFCDLAVMLADGGRCVSDLAALAGQASLFGEVASVSTARRVVLSVGESRAGGIRAARAARSRAGVGGGRGARAGDPRLRRHPDRCALREGAGGRALQGRVRVQPAARDLRARGAGRDPAGRGTPARTTPRITSSCWTSRSSSCPQSALDGEILARSDSAGASHDLADACRETRIRFSFGYPIDRARPRGAARACKNRRGGRRSTRTASRATGRG